MTYNEETEQIKREIASLTKRIASKKEVQRKIDETYGNNYLIYPPDINSLEMQLKNSIISDEVTLERLNRRLKEGAIARRISKFHEENPVEHVSGRIYRGTPLGLMVHFFVTTCITCLVFIIIALLVTGIASLFK